MNDGTRQGPRLLQKMDEPGRRFEIYAAENPLDLYVDGIANVIGGAATSRIDFFNTQFAEPLANGEMFETRQVRVRVVIPTAQFLEGVIHLVTQLGTVEGQIAAGMEQYKNAVLTLLQKLRSMNVNQ